MQLCQLPTTVLSQSGCQCCASMLMRQCSIQRDCWMLFAITDRDALPSIPADTCRDPHTASPNVAPLGGTLLQREVLQGLHLRQCLGRIAANAESRHCHDSNACR